MSAECHKQRPSLRQRLALLDHLVGAARERQGGLQLSIGLDDAGSGALPLSAHSRNITSPSRSSVS